MSGCCNSRHQTAQRFEDRGPVLFKSTCIKPFGGGQHRAEYEDFLKQMTISITLAAKKPTPSPGGPQSIAKVYTARHLTLEGPASYAYAIFGFSDVEFVDLGGGPA